MQYVTKVVPASRTTHDGFTYPDRDGEVVEATDWNPKPMFGGGLHGWLNGIGDTTLDRYAGQQDAVWYLFAVEDEDLIELHNRCKFRKGTVVVHGTSSAFIAWTLETLLPQTAHMPVIGVERTVADHAVVSAGDYSSITAHGRSLINAGSNCAITADTYCAINAHNSCTIVAQSFNTINAHQHAHVVAATNNNIYVRSKSVVSCGHNNIIRALGSARIACGRSCLVEAFEPSTVCAGVGTVILYGGHKFTVSQPYAGRELQINSEGITDGDTVVCSFLVS